MVGVAVCVLLLPVGTLASGLDAFVLAVDHFDPDHERGLGLDGPEVEFLRQALAKAREAIPEVVGIHVRTDGAGGDKMRPTMFRTLQLFDPEKNWERRTLTPEIMAAIAAQIGGGCEAEIVTNEKRPNQHNPIISKSSLWTLASSSDEKSGIELCDNQEIVRWLHSRGVTEILLKENSYKGRDRAKLYLRFGHLVDMEFKSKQLMADPLYSDLFGTYELKPYLGNLFGDGNSVDVVSEAGYSGFDGVVIVFTAGFGDCPSGCIYSHHWIFKYRTMGEKKGDIWPLVGGLSEEGGTPLPEHMRMGLRQAEAIR